MSIADGPVKPQSLDLIERVTQKSTLIVEISSEKMEGQHMGCFVDEWYYQVLDHVTESHMASDCLLARNRRLNRNLKNNHIGSNQVVSEAR